MRQKSKKRYRRASVERNTATSNPTRRRGRGEAVALLKVTVRAMPVVATAQLVVVSRRVRQTVLRYNSPRYRCASAPMSAGLKGGLSPEGASGIAVLPVRLRQASHAGAVRTSSLKASASRVQQERHVMP